ncbi:hypothetical protein GCM10009845_10540 [Pedococcus bigeumensis]
MVANGTLSTSVEVSHRRGSTERIVKYIANRPAKNISSLESQTMVPTDTMLGRDTGPWPGMLPAERAGSEVTGDAVATCARLATFPVRHTVDPPMGA